MGERVSRWKINKVPTLSHTSLQGSLSKNKSRPWVKNPAYSGVYGSRNIQRNSKSGIKIEKIDPVLTKHCLINHREVVSKSRSVGVDVEAESRTVTAILL